MEGAHPWHWPRVASFGSSLHPSLCMAQVVQNQNRHDHWCHQQRCQSVCKVQTQLYSETVRVICKKSSVRMKWRRRGWTGSKWFRFICIVCCLNVFGTTSFASKVSRTMGTLERRRWRTKSMNIVNMQILVWYHCESVMKYWRVKKTGAVERRWVKERVVKERDVVKCVQEGRGKVQTHQIFLSPKSYVLVITTICWQNFWHIPH